MGELEAREVMRLVHWLLALPREEELAFRQDVKEMEASMHMPRRSTYEQIVWEEGLEQGLEKGRDEGRVEGRIAGAQEVLVDLVAERFGGVGPGLRGRIESIVDGVRLRQLARAAVTVSSLSEFEQRVGQ
jgi:predicted transposase YdaD